MKRQTAIALAALVALILSLTFTASAQQKSQAALRREAKITLEQARATALERAPGKIEGEELEREHGKLVYSFDIRNAGGTITEVQVSAIDNSIVAVEEETAAQEAAEKRKEEQEKKRRARRRRNH